MTNINPSEPAAATNETPASADGENFQDKDENLLNSAKWYIEGLNRRLVKHTVRLVIESRPLKV